MKSPDEIKNIIIEETTKNKHIGFIKDNNLFFLNIGSNYKIAPYKIYAFGLMIIPMLLGINYPNLFKGLWFEISLIIPAVLSISFVLLETVACDHFLVYDIQRNSFYTLSYLLGKIPLPFFTTDYFQSSKIKKIILFTAKGGSRIGIRDQLIVATTDDKEVNLTDLMDSSRYHDSLMDWCKLFCLCFDVDFDDRTNFETIEEKEKAIEEVKISYEKKEEFQPIVLFFAIIGFIYAMSYIIEQIKERL